MAEREERQQQVAQDHELRCRPGSPREAAVPREWPRAPSSVALAPAPSTVSRVPYSPLVLPLLRVPAFLKARHRLSRLALRLAREQARVRELQAGSQRLEEQRGELVGRLQALLQAHWEEASRLLSTAALPPSPPVRCSGLRLDPFSGNLAPPQGWSVVHPYVGISYFLLLIIKCLLLAKIFFGIDDDMHMVKKKKNPNCSKRYTVKSNLHPIPAPRSPGSSPQKQRLLLVSRVPPPNSSLLYTVL